MGERLGRYVRFTPKSGHVQCTSVCPLCANSGHRGHSITSGVGYSDFKDSRKRADRLHLAKTIPKCDCYLAIPTPVAGPHIHMTNGDTNGDPSDKFRVDLEVITAPLRSNLQSNYETAIKFADGAIKSAFALNGGSLIGVPAFIALFKIDAKVAAVSIMAAGAMFVVGLIFATLASLLGYLASMTGVRSINNSLRATISGYETAYRQTASTANVQALEQRARTLFDRSIWLRRLGIGAGAASLTSFVIGAAISGYVLVNFQP